MDYPCEICSILCSIIFVQVYKLSDCAEMSTEDGNSRKEATNIMYCVCYIRNTVLYDNFACSIMSCNRLSNFSGQTALHE